MIFEAIELIRTELETYIRLFAPPTTVDMGGTADMFETTSTGKVILTLVNMEEEQTLKNTSPYYRNALGGFDVKNPPVFLNLFVLITVNHTTYSTALKILSWAVQCFQGKNHFTLANTPEAMLDTDPQVSSLRVTVDLCSLSFEKVNQLWGTLGGKQLPFVLYKMRVVEEQADKQLNGGGAILNVEGKMEVIKPVAEN